MMTAEEFCEIKEELGLTKVALARMIGKKDRMVGYYISGEQPISPTVEKLLRAIVEAEKTIASYKSRKSPVPPTVKRLIDILLER